MPKQKKLADYSARRNTKKSGEPAAKRVKTKTYRGPTFIIQKHAARHVHYDFRIEHDGVLKSWAVPKGPSLNPSEKRLAIVTDDHPMAYATFEGVIPKGNYGAGAVMVWDTGTYKNIKKKNGKRMEMGYCFDHGTIEIFLYGTKLQGAFALIRTQKDNQWLLIKMNDEHADRRRNPVKTENKSVLTGRTMLQINKDARDE